MTEFEEANTKDVPDHDPAQEKQKNIEHLLVVRNQLKQNTGSLFVFSSLKKHKVNFYFLFIRKRSRSSSSSNSDSDAAGSRRLRLGRSNKLSEVERLAEIERQRAAQNARIM